METIKKKTIFLKNFSWSVASEVFLKILSFVFLVVFSRKLGQTVLGVFTYIFSVVSLVSMFWDLGVGSFYGRKWVTEDQGYEEDVKNIFGSRLVFIGLTLFFLVPYIFFYESAQIVEIFLVVAITIVDLFKSVPASYFLSKNRFDQTFVINIVDRGIYYGGSTLCLLLGLGLRSVLICFLLAKIISGIVGNQKKFSLSWPSFRFSAIWVSVKNGMPLFLVGVLGSLYFRIDSLMIKYFLGFDWLGAYSAAYRLLDASSVFTGIIGGSIFPVLVSTQVGSKEWLSAILTKNIKYVSVVGIFVTAVLLTMHDQVIVFLYGSQFLAARRVLPFLAPTIVFLFLNYVLGQQLIASHRERYVVKVLVVLSIINILLNWYMIPAYGIIGAALSTLVCEIANSLLLLKNIDVNIQWGWVVPLALSFLACLAMLKYFTFYWMLNAAISGLIYVALLTVLKVVKIEDFKFVHKN